MVWVEEGVWRSQGHSGWGNYTIYEMWQRLVFLLTKISIVRFYQWRLGSQMLGWKSASSDMQRKHPDDLPLQEKAAPFLHKLLRLNVPPFHFLCVSIILTSLLGFFPMFIPHQLVAFSASGPSWLYLVPFIISRKLSIKGTCKGWATPQLETGFSVNTNLGALSVIELSCNTFPKLVHK